MARNFWPKALRHQHFGEEIESARFRVSPQIRPGFGDILETNGRQAGGSATRGGCGDVVAVAPSHIHLARPTLCMAHGHPTS